MTLGSTKNEDIAQKYQELDTKYQQVIDQKKKLSQEIADLMNLQSKQDGVLEGKEVF